MMKLAEKMPVDESVKSKASPVCFLPSELDIKHAEPQLIEESTEASLVGRESMALGQSGASNPGSGRLKMQASNMCLKHFVIFDHCDGQNTVILHPSWLHGPPQQSSLERNSLREVNHFLDSLQAFNSKSMDAMLGIHSSAALCPAFRDQPALQVQQKSNLQTCGPIDRVNYEGYNFEKQVYGTSTHLDVEQESLGEFHENTDEINALLSSDDDDELSSTGHSPSDGASICHSGTINRPGTNILGKKRKLEASARDEVDDADLGFCQSSLGHVPLKSRRYGSSGSLQFPSESDHKNSPSGVRHGNALCENTMSSRFHVAKQLIVNEGQHESKQSLETFGDGGLMDSPKRIKIKSNVQQLKNVIPGGKLLDTASVLDRTIHYVKCLQDKLRGLEAASESAWVMHQIG